MRGHPSTEQPSENFTNPTLSDRAIGAAAALGRALLEIDMRALNTEELAEEVSHLYVGPTDGTPDEVELTPAQLAYRKEIFDKVDPRTAGRIILSAHSMLADDPGLRRAFILAQARQHVADIDHLYSFSAPIIDIESISKRRPIHGEHSHNIPEAS